MNKTPSIIYTLKACIQGSQDINKNDSYNTLMKCTKKEPLSCLAGGWT